MVVLSLTLASRASPLLSGRRCTLVAESASAGPAARSEASAGRLRELEELALTTVVLSVTLE